MIRLHRTRCLSGGQHLYSTNTSFLSMASSFRTCSLFPQRFALNSPKQQSSHRQFSNSSSASLIEDAKFSYYNRSAESLSAGFLAGVLGSLVGMGGAFVVLPFMTGYLRVPTHTAHATSAAVVFLAALSGSIMFYMATGDSNQDAAKSHAGELNQPVSASSASSVSEASSSSTSSSKAASGSNVDLATALALSAASVPMSLVGVRLARNLSAFTLHTMLGGWMLVVAPLSLYADSIKQQRTNEAALSTSPQSISSRAQLTQPDWINERSWLRDFCSKYNLYFRDTQHSLSAIGIGSFSGVLAGMFGVGGGALMVPAMCTFTDLDYKTVIGTSMASIIPVSFASSVAQIWARSLSFSLAIPLGIGCSAGAIVGAKIAKKVDDQYLKYVFVSIMGISGAQRLWKAAQVKLLKK